MKAWFLTGPRRLELQEVPDPEPGPDQAVIRVEAVGICGSDAECYAGKHPLPNYPRLPGHEFAGQVTAVGSAWEGAPAGARVVVDPALACGRCYPCRRGRHNCCAALSIAGVHRPGALADYALCKASQLYPMPNNMTFETAALVETLSIAAQALRRADLHPRDDVVILGAGPIGLCCLMMAKHLGARVLISEPIPSRLALAEDLGADTGVNPDLYPLSEAARDFTAACGANVVVDATGDVAGAQAALSVAGPAGRVVILTLSEVPIRVRPWQLVRQELTILGSRLSLAPFDELMGLAASRKIHLDRLVTHRYAMSDAERAFRTACDRPQHFVKAIVLPQS